MEGCLQSSTCRTRLGSGIESLLSRTISDLEDWATADLAEAVLHALSTLLDILGRSKVFEDGKRIALIILVVAAADCLKKHSTGNG